MAHKRYKYLQRLAERVETDAALAQEISDDPAGTLAQLSDGTAVPDTLVYRIVVLSLGSAVIITLLAAAVLAGYGKAIPEGIIAIGSAAAGALAGLLAPSPARD
jgi:hypothetical protein